MSLKFEPSSEPVFAANISEASYYTLTLCSGFSILVMPVPSSSSLLSRLELSDKKVDEP